MAYYRMVNGKQAWAALFLSSVFQQRICVKLLK